MTDAELIVWLREHPKGIENAHIAADRLEALTKGTYVGTGSFSTRGLSMFEPNPSNQLDVARADQRGCWFCRTPIAECGGFVLARDIVKMLEGKTIFDTPPRELCQHCADKMAEIVGVHIAMPTGEVQNVSVELAAALKKLGFAWLDYVLRYGGEHQEKQKALNEAVKELVNAYVDGAVLFGAAAAWRPMEKAPRDGTLILLLDRTHGVVEARFSPGEWSSETPDHPREYSGAVWVCGDDVFQIEVEEWEEGHQRDDGTALGWLPRDSLPVNPIAYGEDA